MLHVFLMNEQHVQFIAMNAIVKKEIYQGKKQTEGLPSSLRLKTRLSQIPLVCD